MSNRTLKVFLCHASGDKPVVRNLYFRLRSAANNILPWLDKEDLLPGQRWEEVIPVAVRNSDIVLVCLSRASIKKTGYVQKEIKYALDVADEQPEGTIFIIPVQLEQCRIPERLIKFHYVSLFEEKGFDRLMRSLSSRATELGIKLETGMDERTYSAEERERIIKWVIADRLGEDVSELTPEGTLEELAGDWIDAFTIQDRLEEEFGIILSEEDAKKSRIVRDVFEAQSGVGG